ncbi:phage regulatory CII family protein [Cohaesibacter sp. ES.047]|uniref:phage regulatory CII family protein n=1 Tax=Cohaesibacter sp. ES.047 TaxID=1798205 RepID=UPI0012FD5DCE|nr:phage regulatory CII family protein [Cohaesibacter sp. ES.047]
MKAALRRLIKLVGGDADCCRVTGRARRQAYSEFASPDREHMNKWPPLREILDLEADVETPEVTQAMARLHGYELVKLPEVVAPKDWALAVGSMSKETGEALNVVLQAFANGGRIDADEIRQWHIDGELDEAIVTLLQIRAMVDRENERGGQIDD